MEIERQKVKLSIGSQRAIALRQHALATFADLQILKAESIAAIARAQHALQSLQCAHVHVVRARTRSAMNVERASTESRGTSTIV